jgi:hypothetical protein
VLLLRPPEPRHRSGHGRALAERARDLQPTAQRDDPIPHPDSPKPAAAAGSKPQPSSSTLNAARPLRDTGGRSTEPRALRASQRSGSPPGSTDRRPTAPRGSLIPRSRPARERDSSDAMAFSSAARRALSIARAAASAMAGASLRWLGARRPDPTASDSRITAGHSESSGVPARPREDGRRGGDARAAISTRPTWGLRAMGRCRVATGRQPPHARVLRARSPVPFQSWCVESRPRDRRRRHRTRGPGHRIAGGFGADRPRGMKRRRLQRSAQTRSTGLGAKRLPASRQGAACLTGKSSTSS